MRHQKNLNPVEIFKHFSLLRKQVEHCTVPIQIIERVRCEESAHQLVSFVKCTNKEKFLATSLEVLRMFDSVSQNFSMIQSIEDLRCNSSRSKETLICCYRNDTEATLPVHSFFKKEIAIADVENRKGVDTNVERWIQVEKQPDYPRVERTNMDYCFATHHEDLASEMHHPMISKIYEHEQVPAVRIERGESSLLYEQAVTGAVL